MKRIFSVLLIFIFALSLVSCVVSDYSEEDLVQAKPF